MIMGLGSPQIWIHLVESSNTDVSGASEVPQSRGKLVFLEAQLLCFCSNVDLDRYRLISIDLDWSPKYKQ